MPDQQYQQFNCYVILGILPNSSPQEIKDAWRRASKKAHPDLGGSNEAQIKVNLAYEVLSDPVKRRSHDIFWRTGEQARTQHRNEKKSSSNRSQNYEDASRQSNRSSTRTFYSFDKRVESAVQSKKAEIWSKLDLEVQSQLDSLKKKTAEQKNLFYVGAATAVVFGLLALQYPLLWFGAALAAYFSTSKLRFVVIEGQKIPCFGSGSDDLLETHARRIAAAKCNAQAEGVDRFAADVASIWQLAGKPSTFDDSEIHVARRLTVALFLSGYKPTHYDANERTLLFEDGDERLAVRFRHRSGAAVNITYIQGLHQFMTRNNSKGFLFCSPGLSGNAKIYANNHGIIWYSLEKMNSWIDDLLNSNSVGPRGDVLANLQGLREFLSSITPKVGFSGYRRRRRW